MKPNQNTTPEPSTVTRRELRGRLRRAETRYASLLKLNRLQDALRVQGQIRRLNLLLEAKGQ